MPNSKLLLLAISLISCSNEGRIEVSFREKLGIPKFAKKVVVLGQSSHLDLSWTKTSDEYWREDVENILKRAMTFLELDILHKVFYSEPFYILKFYDSLKDEEKKKFLRFFDDERFQILGGGWTTPDVLVNQTEAILRDYLETHRMLTEKLGREIDIKDNWLPDSFGLSGNLPDVLSSSGFRSVGFSRIDGIIKMTVSSLIALKRPLVKEDIEAGSSAGKLFDLGTNTFFWRGRNGGKVLAYWMPYLYGQGDNLLCKSLPAGFFGKESACGSKESEVDEDGFLKNLQIELGRLEPFSKRIPYTFITAGLDFVPPIEIMGERVRFWNENYYPETGTYIVIGSFKDFVDLVLEWAEDNPDAIPEISEDLEPYWTGFYGSRTLLKSLIKKSLFSLLALETLFTIYDSAVNVDTKFRKEMRELLNNLYLKMIFLTSNHDLVTGTTYPDVITKEQIPFASSVLSEVEGRLSSLLSKVLKIFGETSSKSIILFNPLWFERSEYVIVPLIFNKDEYFGLKLYSPSDGKYLQYDGVYEKRFENSSLSEITLIFETNLPAFGIKTIVVEPSSKIQTNLPKIQEDEDENSFRFYNGDMTVEVMKKGNVINIKRRGEVMKLYDVLWEDDGGMWRIGSEFKKLEGCSGKDKFTRSTRTPNFYSLEKIFDSNSLKYLSVNYVEKEFNINKIIKIYYGKPYVDFEISSSSIPEGYSITENIESDSKRDLITETYFEVVKRDRKEKFLYEPTFFPFLTFFSFGDFAVSMISPSGVAKLDDNTVSAFFARNAAFEKCDILGPGKSMADKGPFISSFRLFFGSDTYKTSYSFHSPIRTYFGSVDRTLSLCPPKCSYSLGKATEPALSVKIADKKYDYVIRFIKPGGDFQSQIFRVGDKLNSKETPTDFGLVSKGLYTGLGLYKKLKN